jgi:rod shape-determining protein MreD
MNALRILAILLVAYVCVFFMAQMNLLRRFTGTQIDLLPALMVYCALSANLGAVTCLAIVAGLLFDSLSGNPLGVTSCSLFLAGCVILLKREMILSDQPYAQFVLGGAASAAVPMLSALLLLSARYEPLIGWGTVWQMGVMAVAGACATPLWFWFFNSIERTFGYQRVSETSFREDREIKRGRD